MFLCLKPYNGSHSHSKHLVLQWHTSSYMTCTQYLEPAPFCFYNLSFYYLLPCSFQDNHTSPIAIFQYCSYSHLLISSAWNVLPANSCIDVLHLQVFVIVTFTGRPGLPCLKFAHHPSALSSIASALYNSCFFFSLWHLTLFNILYSLYTVLFICC